jgi:hypothetical protein
VTGKLVFFYHPLRVSKDLAYEGVNWADGKLMQATGAKIRSSARVCFLGGVSSLLPICEKIKTPDLLIEFFRLIYICLKDKPEN